MGWGVPMQSWLVAHSMHAPFDVSQIGSDGCPC
jgi:hypothetical protein